MALAVPVVGLLLALAVAEAVTGHTVVETGTTEVTTTVDLAGQLTTVGAQLVTVTKLVEYTVEVVYWGAGLEAAAEPVVQAEAADARSARVAAE